LNRNMTTGTFRIPLTTWGGAAWGVRGSTTGAPAASGAFSVLKARWLSSAAR